MTREERLSRMKKEYEQEKQEREQRQSRLQQMKAESARNSAPASKPATQTTPPAAPKADTTPKSTFTMQGTGAGEASAPKTNFIDPLAILRKGSSTKPTDLLEGKLTSVGAKAEHQQAEQELNQLKKERAASFFDPSARNPESENFKTNDDWAAELKQAETKRDAAAQNYYELKGRETAGEMLSSDKTGLFAAAVDAAAEILSIEDTYRNGGWTNEATAALTAANAKKAKAVEALVVAGNSRETVERAVGFMAQQKRTKAAAEETAATQKWADEHPGAAAALSVATSPAQGLDYIHALTGNLGHNSTKDIESYKPLTGADFSITGATQALREGASADMGGVGKFLYNTGMSIADSTLLITTIGPAAGVVLGMGAASSTTKDALERGGTNAQALTAGFAAGVAEMVFEKFSIDGLIKMKDVKTVRTAVTNALKQAGVEASEEVFTEISNIVTDGLIMGQNSNYNKAVQAYINSGMSADEAKKKAMYDNIAQVALAGVGGFLSGGVTGGAYSGGQVAVQKAREHAANTLNGQALKAANQNFDLLEAAKNLDHSTQAYQTAVAMEANLDQDAKGEKISDAQWGRLRKQVAEELSKVQTPEAKRELEQVTHPAEKVMSPTAQAFMDAGDDAKTADIKSSILDRVMAGDTSLTDGELRKLDLNSTSTRAVFQQATGTTLPGVTDRKTLLAAARDTVQRIANAKVQAEQAAVQLQETQASIQARAQAVAEEKAAQVRQVAAEQQTDTQARIQQEAADAQAATQEAANAQSVTQEVMQEAARMAEEAELRAKGTETQNSATEAGADAQVRSSVTMAAPETASANGAVSVASEGVELGVAQKRTVDYINAVLPKGAAKVELGTLPGSEDAYFDRATNTIKLNAAKYKSQRDLTHYLGHELVHNADAHGLDDEMTRALAEFGKSEFGEARWNDMVQEKSDLYYKFYTGEKGYSRMAAARETTQEKMTNEVAADLMADIFDDAGVLERFAQADRTTAQKLRDALAKFRDRLIGEVAGVGDALVRGPEVRADVDKLIKTMDELLRKGASRGTMKENEESKEESTDAERRGQGFGGVSEQKTAGQRVPDGVLRATPGAQSRDGGAASEERVDARGAAEEPARAQSSDLRGEGQTERRYSALGRDDLRVRKKLGDWVADAIVDPAPGSASEYARGVVQDHQIECFVLDDAAMAANNRKVAFTRGDTILLSDAITEELKEPAARHELVHVMKRTEFYPYTYFLMKAESVTIPGALRDSMIAHTMGHVQKTKPALKTTNPDDLASLDFDLQRDVWDEFCAIAYGAWIRDPAGFRADWGSAFADLDYFMDEIGVILEQFKVRDPSLDRKYYSISTPAKADTNTPEFRKWFKDDSGLLTNEDGSPKVFLRGSVHAGSTQFHNGEEATSKGIFFTEQQDVAEWYADQANTAEWIPPEEFIPRELNSWREAQAFVENDLGRFISLERDPDGWSVYTRQERTGWKLAGEYENTPDGLAKFNADYGRIIQENRVVNPGWYSGYLSAENTLVYDAQGRNWSNIDGKGKWTNHLAEEAWAKGYDAVIIRNVVDGGSVGEFDENDVYSQRPTDVYVVRDSAQFKSVYNTGAFDRGDPDIRYSVGPDNVPDWGTQVNALLNKSFNDLFWGDGKQSSALYVKFEPTALLQELGLSDLPLIITQKHAWDTMQPRYDGDGKLIDQKYHGITEEQFRRLPELIENPVAVFKSDPSATHRGGVNILTDERDSRGNPVFVTIATDRPGYAFDGKTGPAHFVNMFSRENYADYLARNVENGGVLYVDKEKLEANPWLEPNRAPSLSTADGIEFGAILQQKDPTVKPGERRFSISGKPLADPLYSQMERVLNEYKGDKIGATSLIPYLKNHGVKQEEIKWSGIEQFLEGKKSVTKDELFEFLRANELVIEDVVLDDGQKTDMTNIDTGEVYTSFDHFQQVVREDVLNYPQMFNDAVITPDDLTFFDNGAEWSASVSDEYGWWMDVAIARSTVRYPEVVYKGYSSRGRETKNYREVLFRLPEVGGGLYGPHWEQTDVLAHTRLSDNVDAEGKKVLFVEEVQSDWHQEGRDKGYEPKEVADAKRRYEEALQAETEADRVYSNTGTDAGQEAMDEARKRRSAAIDARRAAWVKYLELQSQHRGASVPDAPYRDTWHEYVMKRVLRMAAEGGYDKVAWTTGQMQADRYGLQKQLRSIEVAGSLDDDGQVAPFYDYTVHFRDGQVKRDFMVAPSEMTELFGHDLGKRLMAAADEKPGGIATVEGDDLAIGGEGMKNFYDVGGKSSQNIPKFLNKYLKPWGVKVQSSLVGKDLTNSSAYRNGGMEEVKRIFQSGLHNMDNLWQVPSVDITEQMRDDLLYKGQPRYSVGGKPRTGGNTGNVNPDTGFERGSVADSFMRMWNVGAQDEALSMLEQSISRLAQIQAEQAEQQLADLRRAVLRPRVTESAAERNRQRIEQLNEKYGMMPQTGAAQQEVRLPQQIDDETRVAGAAQTLMAADVTNEVVGDELVQGILSGDEGLTYHRVGDKATLEQVDKDYERLGFRQMRTEWEHVLNGGEVTKLDIAKAEKLYVEACANKDVDAAMKLAAEIAAAATRAGQTVQAMTLLKKMTPSGQAYYIQKVVDRLNKDPKQKNPITLDEKLVKNLLNAKTRDEVNAAVDALIQSVADQVPVTLADKWNTWRYFAMLGNPRTHIRNLAGNAIFTPARLAKDVIGTGLERLILRDQRKYTKSLTASKELRDFAKQDAEEMKDILRGGGKYNPADQIRDRRTIFGNTDRAKTAVGKVVSSTAGKATEWLRAKNSAFLEAEDWGVKVPGVKVGGETVRLPGLRSAYVHALSHFLSARGVSDPNSLTSSPKGRKLLNEARSYAVREAQRATYRDMSKLAGTLNHLKRNHKVLGVFLDGLVPFTKTPINIVKRGFEYSPLGLVKSLYDGVAKVHKGTMSGAELIDELSANLTGTGVALLGVLLAHLGLLTGALGDDDEDKFEELQGEQAYSLKIGGTSYTIDWMAPVALPLFVGAEIYNTISADYEDVEPGQVLSAVADGMASILEPMLSLSMLDGLNDALSSNKYGEREDAIWSLLSTVGTSYISQGVPTVMGQLARTIDPNRRTSFTQKGDGSVESMLKRFWQNSVQGKVPFYQNEKMAFVDAWGRVDTTGSIALRAFENFISPGYINERRTTDVEVELERLSGELKDTTVLPDRAQKYFTVDKETYAMSQGEYQAHLIDRGQTSYRLVSDFIHDPVYDKLTDEERAEVINDIYDYAAQSAKYHTNSSYDRDKWIGELEDYVAQGGDAVDYLTMKTQAGSDSISEVAYRRDDLSAAEMSALILGDASASQRAPKSFSDPYAKGYVYEMTPAQQAQYTETFDELFNERFFELYRSEEYRQASAEERKELVKDLRAEVSDDTKREMADWLYNQGVDSKMK